MQNHEALFVPGLLQTAEATRAIIEDVAPTVSEVELDNLVAARMARRAVRDSNNSTGSVLAIPPHVWTAFTTALRTGDWG